MSFETAAAISACVAKQSTLTYTLIDEEKITWSEFSLIIRSLHNYEVISISESQESKTISVTVGYFANARNARKRLGQCVDFIEVSRESTNVRLDELQSLQQLRRKFGFGGNNDDEEPPTPKPNKKRRYANCN